MKTDQDLLKQLENSTIERLALEEKIKELQETMASMKSLLG